MFERQRQYLLVGIRRVGRRPGKGCHQVAAGIGGGGGLIGGGLQLGVGRQVFENFRLDVLFDSDSFSVRIVGYVNQVVVVIVQHVRVARGGRPASRAVRGFGVDQLEVVHPVNGSYIGRCILFKGEDANGIAVVELRGVAVLSGCACGGGVSLHAGNEAACRGADGEGRAVACIVDALRLICYFRAASQSATARDEEGGAKEAADEGMFVFKRHNYLVFFYHIPNHVHFSRYTRIAPIWHDGPSTCRKRNVPPASHEGEAGGTEIILLQSL